MASSNDYANKDWVKAEIEGLKMGVREAKHIGIEARRLANDSHICVQRDIIESLREEQLKIIEELGHWRFFKKFFFVVIGIILSIMVMSAGTVISFAMSTKESTSNIEHAVKTLATRHSDLVDRVNIISSQNTEENKQQLDRIQQIIRNTIKEEKEDISKNTNVRKRRRM